MDGASIHRSLHVARAAMELSAPFRISGYVFDAMPSIVVHIEQGGQKGRGEAAGVYYVGDDQDRMVDMVESVRGLVEGGISRDELQLALPPCGARNALDCALWELESCRLGRPVWELAGVPEPQPLVSTFTLPAEDPAILANLVGTLDFAKAIKLKLDGDLAADAERLAVVRAARPDAWLGVDANQGFASNDLDRLETILIEYSVALLEQPTPRGEESALAGWRPPFPVAADESILDLTELGEKAAYFDVINIKLDKCGGLTEALAMARAARSMGKQVMVGNMGGSTLAMAPGFVVGQLCEVVDLDGPANLADDVLADSIYSDGRIFVPEAIWGAQPVRS
jgi:L-alanine-DL-glutamate epimerase-like enolase superfamily enzyme